MSELLKNEVNPEKLENGLLNFYKRRMQSKIFHQMAKFKMIHYNLKEVPVYQQYLMPESEDDIGIMILRDDKLLFQASIKCEANRTASSSFSAFPMLDLSIEPSTPRESNDPKEDILSGMRKRSLSRWWLDMIRTKCEQFLLDLGYDFKAVPRDYLESPPPSMEAVRQNLEIILKVVDTSLGDSCNLSAFLIDPLKSEIYKKVEEFFRLAKEVLMEQIPQLQSDQDPTTLNLSQCKLVDEKNRKRVEDLIKDLKYLQEMRRLEFDYFDLEKKEHVIGRGLTDTVPVTGLIISRFYRLENELRSVIDQWGSK